MASTNNSVIPTTLLESPSFQLERLRRRTRDGVEAALQTKQTTLREYWVLTCLVDADAAPALVRAIRRVPPPRGTIH